MSYKIFQTKINLKKMIKKILFSTILLLVSLITFAQETGKITGKVSDASNNETVIGATIAVKGTTNGTFSQADGSFVLENLNEGNYTIVCSFMSFKTIEKQIEIKTGETKTVNFDLLQETLELEEVNISARATKNTENAVLNIQRKTISSVNGISSKEISLNGDSNAASSLKRVTGVTIQGGKYMYVRGLGDRYTVVELNEAEIPILDPEKNTVQLDLFSSGIIENMLVYKSFTPDLPGNFAGGYLNITTKDFPEKMFFNFSTSVGFNPQANLRNDFLFAPKGKYDLFAVSDNSRNVPDNVKNGVPYRYENDTKLDIQTKSFNKKMDIEKGTSFFNHSHSFSFGNNYKIGRRQLGFIFGVNYNRNFKFYENGTNSHYILTNKDAENLQKDLFMKDAKGSENVTIATILNTNFKINKNHSLGLNFIHNRSGNNTARYQDGINYYHEVNYQTRSLHYTERKFSTAQIRGKHKFDFLNNFEIDWQSSYTYSNFNEPDLRFFSNIYTVNGNDTVYEIDFAKQDLPSRYFREMNETSNSNKINFSLKTKHFKTKFGFVYNNKNRIFIENIYNYNDRNNSYTGNIKEYLSDSNIGMNVDNYIENYGLYISDASQLSNNYSGNSQLVASYILFETSIKNLKINAGVRTEKMLMNVASKNEILKHGNLDNLDFLPAVNLTYELSTKTNIKASYTRTLARPSFRELAPYASFEFVGDYIFVGNENLIRTTIDNIDIRWDFFSKRGELFSVSYFYKHFKNPIERTFNPEASNDELTLVNAEKAQLHGIELEFRKQLSFISGLKNVKVGANFTAVTSTVNIDIEELETIRATNPTASSSRNMYGQAPYVVNVFIMYDNEKQRFTSILNFNVSGARPAIIVKGGTPDIYEQARPEMNFAVSKKIGKSWTIKLSAKNLLNSDNKKTYTYKNKEYVYSNYSLGRVFSVKASYRL